MVSAAAPVWFPRPGTADRFLPGHTVRLEGGLTFAGPDTVDVDDGSVFLGELYLGDFLGGDETTEPGDRARTAAVAAIMDRVQEVLEWTLVDGRRLAAPHPRDDESAWALLSERVEALLDRYIEWFPAEAASG